MIKMELDKVPTWENATKISMKTSYIFFFLFMVAPQPGVKLELHQYHSNTRDPSHLCELCGRLRQRQI